MGVDKSVCSMHAIYNCKLCEKSAMRVVEAVSAVRMCFDVFGVTFNSKTCLLVPFSFNLSLSLSIYVYISPFLFYIHLCWFCYCPLAKATSCRAAIRTARGVVDDIGEEGARKSPGLGSLAKCREGHSERDVHKVVAKDYKLSLPIDMTSLPKAPGTMYSGEIKVLAIMSWLRFLVDYNVWHLLRGLRKADPPRERSILLEFWKRFRKLRPTHEVFKLADSNRLDLSRCAPLMVHGDEGRGRKKVGFWFSAFIPT